MRVIRDGDLPATLADPAHFTGRVWRTDVLPRTDSERMSGLRLFYEPGARSHWHIHDREQVIVAVQGRGLVAWEGLSAPVALTAGDWWHVQAGVAHWHGAGPTDPFAHLAVTAGGGTTWLGEVPEESYRRTAAEPPADPPAEQSANPMAEPPADPLAEPPDEHRS